ncbi:hypothetical protein NL676_039292 [Syzygium grande]|nr:hypothetical protein NL676_039292 [Syzygium grande]
MLHFVGCMVIGCCLHCPLLYLSWGHGGLPDLLFRTMIRVISFNNTATPPSAIIEMMYTIFHLSSGCRITMPMNTLRMPMYVHDLLSSS